MLATKLVDDLLDILENKNACKQNDNGYEIDINAVFNFEKTINLNKYKRILIIGMGGGCDVFSAYSYCKYLQQICKSKNTKNTLLFGNCTGIRNDLKKHEKVSHYLYKISNFNEFTKADINVKNYGTTKLEESMKAEYDNNNDSKEKEFCGPFLFVVPIRKYSDEINNVELASVANNHAMSESFKYLNVDLVIGIDNGGDSLTCGIDYSNNPEMGRDRQVLNAMVNNKYGIPYLHFVFGPGCDGESSVKQLEDAMMNKTNHFLGKFELNQEIVDVMLEKMKYLGETRTPNIMCKAFLNKEMYNDKLITIPRGLRVSIPNHWLYSVWAFSSCNL